MNTIKYLYTHIKETYEQIKNMETYEKSAMIDIFLSRVNCTFFLFDINNDNTEGNLKGSICDLLHDFIDNPPNSFELNNCILEVSDQLGKNGISEAYLYPFMKSNFHPYYTDSKTPEKIQNYFKEFITTHYSYVCFFKFEGKLIMMTDVKEEKIFKDLLKMEKDGYKLLEFYKIIPKIIDSLKSKVLANKKLGSTENVINEMGIGFPLSMIGHHSSIKTTLKSSGNISSDKNFRKIINFGVLDYLKIKLDYKISFNNDNEKNKFTMYGYIYTGYQGNKNLNTALLDNLSNFISDIDGSEIDEIDDFIGLPIYIITKKYIYNDISSFPYFTYKKSFNELKLNITYENQKGIQDSFIINGIFPRYIKIRNENFAYLKVKEKNDSDLLKNYEFEEEYFRNSLNELVNCKTFLEEMIKNIKEKYYYRFDDDILEEISNNLSKKDDINHHGGPNFLIGDIYLTATRLNDEYLINISDIKKDNARLCIEVYKLAHNNLRDGWIENIIQKADIDKNGNYIGNIEVGKKDTLPLEISNIITGYRYKIINKSQYSNTGKILGYKKPLHTVDDKHIDGILKFEDFLSCGLISLLRQEGHRVFFGGKANGKNARELADIISITENMKSINLNLFHIKTKPFRQKSYSTLEASFSLYTEVVGQVLEKSKGFLDKHNIEGILSELKAYFMEDRHHIYEAIEKSLLQCKNRKKKLYINVYFPIRYKDYFTYDRKSTSEKKLAVDTNWKRLRMINDVFKTNIDNIAIPNLDLSFNIGLIVCKKVKERKNELCIKNNLYLYKNIDDFFYLNM